MLTTNLDQRFHFLCFGSDPTKVDGRQFGDLVLPLTSRILARVWRRLSWLIVSPVGQVCPFFLGEDLVLKRHKLLRFVPRAMGFGTSIHSLKLTAKAPEAKAFKLPQKETQLFQPSIFRCELAVSFREGQCPARNRSTQTQPFFQEKKGHWKSILSRDTAWRIKVREVLKTCGFDVIPKVIHII